MYIAMNRFRIAIGKEDTFIWLQSLNPLVAKRIQKYGPIAPYPFGMTNFIKKPIKRGEAIGFFTALMDFSIGSCHQ